MLKSALSLFSVEQLDTRIAPPADEKKRQAVISRAGPSRWKSPEFVAYAVIHAVCVPLMFKAAMDASSPENVNYDKYKHLLEPGWIFGRLVDNSDGQYAGFRNNLPYLVGLMALHQGLRRAVPVPRVQFDIGFGVFFLTVLYGVNVAKILGLLYVNFRISGLEAASHTKLALTWAFGIGLLFSNELCHGYPLGALHPSLAFIDQSWSGVMGRRWDVNFNFSMMRMVSFGVDRLACETIKKPESEPKVDVVNERARIDTPLAPADYSLLNYLGYSLYTPLYVAGPILTFNDYVRQTRQTLPSIRAQVIVPYTVRFLVCLLTMEVLLHYTSVVAISQTRAWQGDSPFQISMIALFNLNAIWLKLLLPWRLFRLWGLLDGIDAPENMIRCVNNNYSPLSFWRAWHRSYNRWVLRYIYIPLGGSSRPLLNSLVVFTFVALWHDIQLRLLLWGWMAVLFVVPELMAQYLAKPYRDHRWYRHACALGGVANVWMMMIANLIGFCVGPDGIVDMLRDMLLTAQGLWYVILSTACLFVGVQAMFEFREREKRKGIDLRC